MKKKFVAVLCSCMALQAVPVFAESEVETETETSIDYEAKRNELLKTTTIFLNYIMNCLRVMRKRVLRQKLRQNSQTVISYSRIFRGEQILQVCRVSTRT